MDCHNVVIIDIQSLPISIINNILPKLRNLSTINRQFHICETNSSHDRNWVLMECRGRVVKCVARDGVPRLTIIGKGLIF